MVSSGIGGLIFSQKLMQISGAFSVCCIIPLGLFLPISDFLLYTMSLVLIYTLIRLLV